MVLDINMQNICPRQGWYLDLISKDQNDLKIQKKIYHMKEQIFMFMT